MCVFGKHSKVSITVVKVRQPAVISCGPHHASTQCDTNRAAEQHGRLIPAFCGRRRGVEKKKREMKPKMKVIMEKQEPENI